MSKSSIETFLIGVNSGKLQTQEAKILRYIRRNPKCTIADIKFHSTGMAESSVTARISDLLDKGLIKIVGTFESKVSNFSELEIVEDKTEREKLAKERNKIKKNRAINQLLNKHESSLDPSTIEALRLEQYNMTA